MATDVNAGAEVGGGGCASPGKDFVPQHLSVPASARAFTWRDLIDFEETAPVGKRTKRKAIWKRFKLLPGRYYWELGRAIDRPEAMRYSPVTVGGLLRARDAGRVRRAVRGDAA